MSIPQGFVEVSHNEFFNSLPNDAQPFNVDGVTRFIQQDGNVAGLVSPEWPNESGKTYWLPADKEADLSKNPQISALILLEVERGCTLQQAFDKTLGHGAYAKMKNEIYYELRGEAVPS